VHHLGFHAVGGHDAEYAAAEQNAGDQLAQHGGLPDTLGELAQQLGGDEDGRQDEEEPGDIHAFGRREQRQGTQDGDGVDRPAPADPRAEPQRGDGAGRCA
jgi:hypothetical protein